MIYIKDNFVDISFIDQINEDEKPFDRVDTPGKSFWVKKPSDELLESVIRNIEECEGNSIDLILSFIREAREGQDNDWRIHNDSIINGQQPDRAGVLYISDEQSGFLNGTAFWEHKIYGDKVNDIDSEGFDRLLNEDSNNLELWNLKSIIGHKKNRFISYPCEYFHSKFPNEFIDNRIVLVIFYKIK